MTLREPFNAISHLVGLILAGGGTLYLLVAATGASQRAAFSIYGATLVLLYATSTVYHALPLAPSRLRPFRTLDHVAIYFLIAGTYTPVALLLLDGAGSRALLATTWAIAAAGIPFKIRWLDAPVWVSTATYLAMGYLALAAVVPITEAVGWEGLGWLVSGGIAYTIGAVIFTCQRPDPLPHRFGYHGLWHLFVLAGSGCHYAFMALHVATRS